MTAMLACDTEENFISLKWLGLNSIGRIIIECFSWHLLLHKIILKEVSVFMPEQCYLFIVKYLVIAAFELLKFEVTSTVFPTLSSLLLFSPEQIWVYKKHPGDCCQGNH